VEQHHDDINCCGESCLRLEVGNGEVDSHNQSGTALFPCTGAIVDCARDCANPIWQTVSSLNQKGITSSLVQHLHVAMCPITCCAHHGLPNVQQPATGRVWRLSALCTFPAKHSTATRGPVPAIKPAVPLWPAAAATAAAATTASATAAATTTTATSPAAQALLGRALLPGSALARPPPVCA
jgi:hypothetical protein